MWMSCGCQLTKVSFGEEFHNWLLDNSESVFERQLPFDGSGLGVVPVVSLAPACKTIFSLDAAVKALSDHCFAQEMVHPGPRSEPRIRRTPSESSVLLSSHQLAQEMFVQQAELAFGADAEPVIVAKHRLAQYYVRQGAVRYCWETCVAG
jgi:hypothetical protein